MKVLLICINSIVEPLGIMYIAAALKKVGHQVDLELIKEKTPLSEIQIKQSYDFAGFSILTGNHKNLLAISAQGFCEIRAVVGQKKVNCFFAFK